MLEYMTKFIALDHFIDDYVATNMAKVRKFEDGLKLSIRGKIVGLLLQDLNLMVKIAIVIERKESQPSSSSLKKKHRTSTPQGFQGHGRGYQGQSQSQSS